MNLRSRNVISCIFLRPWLGVSFGLWLAFTAIYFWWLVSQNHVLQKENKYIRSELQLSKEFANAYNKHPTPKEYSTLCETIHIALICLNKCTQQLTPMLKSLLHYRQNPLYLHFVVDTVSGKTITELFNTWELPDVNFTCYDAEEHLYKVQWIPNTHYSGIFALLKLLFPELLPKTLDQVIVLDTDLTFLSDIRELWVMFRNMSDEQAIGLVENESNWYLGQTNKRWPAIGRGFNTGVMLLDLKKMRERIDWTDLWQNAVTDNIKILKHTMLADQDVINAIIKGNTRLVYNITCQYNIQMSTQTLSKECYGADTNFVKIVHWNSPTKYEVKLQDAKYFRNIHKSFIDMDGNVFREKLHKCYGVEAVTAKFTNSDLCSSFRAAQRAKLRTHLYYMEYNYAAVDAFDVTLVLQLSMDRLQFLERLVKYWDGPLSAAIYLSDCDITEFDSFIRDWSETLNSRRNIGYHLVFKQRDVHYPVNYLRNVALSNVNTPYVFLMDVDFVPMASLYSHLRQVLQLINPYPQRKCLVVPAFETQRYRVTPPRNKAALVARLINSSGDVGAFRAKEWPRGHRPTNYSRWVSATIPYEVEWQPDYEPYLVVHSSVPKYDTRFSGFGWNKVSHSVELKARGYKAVVLPDAFVVHTPHAPSLDITKFRANTHYRICLALLKQEFIDDLKKRYNVSLDETSQQDAEFLQQARQIFLDQAKDP